MTTHHSFLWGSECFTWWYIVNNKYSLDHLIRFLLHFPGQYCHNFQFWHVTRLLLCVPMTPMLPLFSFFIQTITILDAKSNSSRKNVMPSHDFGPLFKELLETYALITVSCPRCHLQGLCLRVTNMFVDVSWIFCVVYYCFSHLR